MLTCKQVARSLADRDYAELPVWKRLPLKLHVLLCFVCRRYHRHVMRFQDGIRRYRKEKDSRTSPPPKEFCLLGDEKNSIQSALKKELAESDRASSGSETASADASPTPPDGDS